MHAMLHLQRQRSDATALGEGRSRAGVYDENGEGKQVIRYLLEESQGNIKRVEPIALPLPYAWEPRFPRLPTPAAANALLTGELRRQRAAHPSRCVQNFAP